MKKLSDLIDTDKDHTKKGLHRENASPDPIVAFSNISCVKEESNQSITNTSEVGRVLTNISNMTTTSPSLPQSALSLEATVKYLQLEMANMQRKHQQELLNMTQAMLKVRENLEQDKRKILADFWKQADKEKQMAIAQIKKKQWCGQCGKESIFYCCWNNTPYNNVASALCFK